MTADNILRPEQHSESNAVRKLQRKGWSTVVVAEALSMAKSCIALLENAPLKPPITDAVWGGERRESECCSR